MKARELLRYCERFTARMIAEGTNPDGGVTRELYMQACALLWDNNNPTDVPVDQGAQES